MPPAPVTRPARVDCDNPLKVPLIRASGASVVVPRTQRPLCKARVMVLFPFIADEPAEFAIVRSANWAYWAFPLLPIVESPCTKMLLLNKACARALEAISEALPAAFAMIGSKTSAPELRKTSWLLKTCPTGEPLPENGNRANRVPSLMTTAPPIPVLMP